MDQFSKFVEAAPMANQEATTVARAFVETVVVRYGVPLQILSDQGKNFKSRVYSEMKRELKLETVTHVQRHHRPDGAPPKRVLGKLKPEAGNDLNELFSDLRDTVRSVAEASCAGRI